MERERLTLAIWKVASNCVHVLFEVYMYMLLFATSFFLSISVYILSASSIGILFINPGKYKSDIIK